MIDKIESKRLVMQSALEKGKTKEQRNRLGQFATPPLLAQDILNHVKKLLPMERKVRFLDPAFGSGAFYTALHQTFGSKAIAQASAFEIDPYYSVPTQSLWAEHDLNLHHTDFTQAEPRADFDLVICNPPYVRHHHLPQERKLLLQRNSLRATGLKPSGLAGLYVHFVLHSHSWMAPSAIAGWLIPSEFMDVNYGRELKEYFLDNVTLLQIHRFAPDDVQFVDALVSSAIVWIKNEPAPSNHSVLFTYGGTLSTPVVKKTVKPADLWREGKWTRFPQLNVRDLNAFSAPTIGDLFSIKRGLATGNNHFFVLSEQQVEEYGLPSKFLRPILPSPRYVKVDQIQVDQEGLPANVSKLFLLDPKMSDEEIEKQSPELSAYLRKGKEAGVHEGYLCRSRKRWYDQEQRKPAPIVCTYMGRFDEKNGRPFRFIRNYSDATVANSYLAMYPKHELQIRLVKDPELLDRIWQQLNQITPEALLGEGRVYGGGLHKLEPKELAKVPLLLK